MAFPQVARVPEDDDPRLVLKHFAHGPCAQDPAFPNLLPVSNAFPSLCPAPPDLKDPVGALGAEEKIRRYSLESLVFAEIRDC